MHRPGPVRILERRALVVGNRDEALLAKLPNHLADARQVEASVQGGEERDPAPAERRQVQPVDVCMNNVELAGATRDRFDQQRTGRVRVDARAPETQGARPHRMQLSARPGIAAREQGHLMAELDQLVDQPSHNPFRTAVKFRGNAFGQRSDLDDPHRPPPSALRRATRGGAYQQKAGDKRDQDPFNR